MQNSWLVGLRYTNVTFMEEKIVFSSLLLYLKENYVTWSLNACDMV